MKNVYEKGKLSELRQLIQKMDPELHKSLDYLKVIIDFLKKNYIQDELFHFQVINHSLFQV